MNRTCAVILLQMLHETTQMFMMVDYETTQMLMMVDYEMTQMFMMFDYETTQMFTMIDYETTQMFMMVDYETTQMFMMVDYETTQMFMMVDYAKEITVKKPCVENADRLSICSSSILYLFTKTHYDKSREDLLTPRRANLIHPRLCKSRACCTRKTTT